MADSKVKTVKVADLENWDKNPRFIKPERFEQLKKSIKEDGFNDVLKLAADGKTVIGGNMRLRALKDLGIAEVEAIVTSAQSPEDMFNVAIRDNESFGEYDREQLVELAYTLNIPKVQLDTYLVHLDSPVSIGDIVSEDTEKEVVEDKAPEVSDEPPVSEFGKVYQLGPHRLMCGSSTESADVAKLVVTRVDLIHTDPPYGVDYKSKKLGTILNDELKGDSLYQLTYDAFAVIKDHTKDHTATYCWYEDKFRHIIQAALEAAGYEYKQNLIWNKGMNLSGADYQKAHENVLYLQYAGKKASWFGGRDKKTILGLRRADLSGMKKQELVAAIVSMQSESTVWDIDRDVVTTYVHPTQKPIKIAARAIQNSTKPGQVVYDGFCGSGSTLIACEQTSRICYGMELDPKYVDVIRKRYAKYISLEDWEESWESLTPAIK